MVTAASSSSSNLRRPHFQEQQLAKRRKHAHQTDRDRLHAFSSTQLSLKPVLQSSRSGDKHYNDSYAVVTNGGPRSDRNGDNEGGDDDSAQSAILISSDESELGDDDEPSRDGVLNKSAPSKAQPGVRNDPLNDHFSGGDSKTQDQDTKFNDIRTLLDKPRFDAAIDVNALLDSEDDAPAHARQLVPAEQALSSPNAITLTAVLTQALTTNDTPMLESCLSLVDLDSIRATIEKLSSPLISSLLNRLAERLHRRPGRAGNLMVWVQWALVAHGGYLAGQPDVIKMLRKLETVIRERASGLTALLGLKGRLDMLNAQLEFRRGVQRKIQTLAGSDREHEAVIYVEGEESSADDAEDVDESSVEDDADGLASEASDQEDLGLENGIDSDDVADDSDDSGVGHLIDDEAEETDDEYDEDVEASEDEFEEGDLVEGDNYKRDQMRSFR